MMLTFNQVMVIAFQISHLIINLGQEACQWIQQDLQISLSIAETFKHA